MKIHDFEKQIKEIDKRLSIKENVQNNICGVFLGEKLLFAIPNKNIYKQKIKSYGVRINNTFVLHRTIPEALELIKSACQKSARLSVTKIK